MAGHGGARYGAGRPPTTIGQARRYVLAGIHLGLADAARTKGVQGSDDECAIAAIRMICGDMVLAGRGEDLVRIYATVSAKGNDDPGERPIKSPILAALEALPVVRFPSLSGEPDGVVEPGCGQQAEGAPDSDSVVPLSDPISGFTRPPVAGPARGVRPPAEPAHAGGELLPADGPPHFEPAFAPQLAFLDGHGRTPDEARARGPGPGGPPPPPARPPALMALGASPHDFSRGSA